MKIAMIGSGGIARRHLGVLAAEPEIEIVAHVAPTLEHAAAAAARWGGRAYRDYADALESEQIDAAWICVPPGAHGALERDLLARNIHLFIEKPLAAERATAETIAAALETSGSIVGVGYHWRALDTLDEVRRTIAANPPRMVLGAWHDSTPPPRWWRRQAESGGQMVEQATHVVDLARSLIGDAHILGAAARRHPRPAFPDADVADVSAALMQFDSGATGVFTATCLLGGPAAINLQLVCEGLLITITQASVVYDTGRERREVRARSDPFAAENRAFLDAVRNDDPTRLLCSYPDALRTHRLCCAVLDGGA